MEVAHVITLLVINTVSIANVTKVSFYEVNVYFVFSGLLM